MCRGYFYSQEIDPHHATEHRSTDQSRNGCGMCCFCHAQPFEITRAKNIKNPLVQRSCQNAEVVEAFCSRRVHHRDRHQHTIPIALAALPGATLPRLRALALFGRRPSECVERPSFRRPKTCTTGDIAVGYRSCPACHIFLCRHSLSKLSYHRVWPAMSPSVSTRWLHSQLFSGRLRPGCTLLWIRRSNLRLSERVCAVHYSVGVQSIDLGVR
jgi:hypothetical protein